MSAARHPVTFEAELEELQCHFTWTLDLSRPRLLRLRDDLDDIGPEEGCAWLGPIYNLQGYVHYLLGSTSDARRCFGVAAEAFRQIRNTVSDEGPWLVVNYGNLAWLHYRLGEQAESESYVSKVNTLLKDYPSPSQNALHAEVYAEKAWTLTKLSRDKKMLAAEYFQRAVRMQPEMVEWQTGHALALLNALGHRTADLEDDVLGKVKIAKEHDPKNLHLAAMYLEARAKKGEQVADEARELAKKVLRKPVSSYSGIKPLLRLIRMHVSLDEAIDLAEEALERYPDERFLRKCAASCYRWKVYLQQDTPLKQSMVDRAISLHRELISAYPHSAFRIKLNLANVCAHSKSNQEEADQLFQELLEDTLDPADSQMLYNRYAKHLNFRRNDTNTSIKYLMKAAEIPTPSMYRENSIRTLEKIKNRNRSWMRGEIEEFLANLQ